MLAAAAILIVPVAAQTLATGFPDVSCQAQPGGDLPTRPWPPDSTTVDDALRPAPTIVTGRGDNGPGLYLPVSQDGTYDLPLPDGYSEAICPWATPDYASGAAPHQLAARPVP